MFIYDIMHQKTMKNGIYLVNVDEYKSIGVHWIDLYVNDNSMTYLDGFRVEHIQKNWKKYWQQKYYHKYLQNTGPLFDSVLKLYIEFIDFEFRGKSLEDFANSLQPDNFEKNDKSILNCFCNIICPIYVDLDNALQLNHSRIKETYSFQKSMTEKRCTKYLIITS